MSPDERVKLDHWLARNAPLSIIRLHHKALRSEAQTVYNRVRSELLSERCSVSRCEHAECDLVTNLVKRIERSLEEG